MKIKFLPHAINFALTAMIALSAFTYAGAASAQTNGQIRQFALEQVPIDAIPLMGYDEPRAGDAAGPVKPSRDYSAAIYAIRDVDTVQGIVDLGFGQSVSFGFRYYGNDGFEITRKGGRPDSHVARGYKCRDLMASWLGSAEVFPKVSKYHYFKEPIPVIVRSIKSDKYAGRWLFIVYKDGVNLNQLAARSGCAIVTTYASKPAVYPRDTPLHAALD